MPKIAPPCPRCNKGPTTPLARDGDIQRFECGPCRNVFTGPALDPVDEPQVSPPNLGVSHLPILPPDPSDVPPRPITPPEPPAPAEGPVSPTGEAVKARCPKCTRPYFRTGQRFDEHVAKCDGVYVAPPAARPSAPSPARPADPLSTPFTPGPETKKALDLSIVALEARRNALQAEIRDIESAVATIRKLQGGEGLDGPFGAGE